MFNQTFLHCSDEVEIEAGIYDQVDAFLKFLKSAPGIFGNSSRTYLAAIPPYVSCHVASVYLELGRNPNAVNRDFNGEDKPCDTESEIVLWNAREDFCCSCSQVLYIPDEFCGA
jgi:hypothetical protein